MRISDWSSDVCSSDLRSRSRRCRSGGARLQLGDASQQGDCRAAGCLLVRPLWLHDVGWCGSSGERRQARSGSTQDAGRDGNCVAARLIVGMDAGAKLVAASWYPDILMPGTPANMTDYEPENMAKGKNVV